MDNSFNNLIDNLSDLINKINSLRISNKNNSILKYIDHIFYINLESRKDRKIQIENEIKKLDPHFQITERFNAIKLNKTKNKVIDGALGCSTSHLEIIKLCKNRGYKNVLILEDDYEFIVSKEYFLNLLDSFYNNIKNYNFMILGTNYASFTDTKFKDIYNVKNTQTTSGYIINESIYDKYIKTIEDSIQNLIKTKNRYKYAIDQAWKPLQNKDTYSFNKIQRIGKQRESFSDIEGHNVNYKC
tara:strand:+ start:10044 stop:10772 length:729 start_codon:yes stop_codon:yes gene_type:complete